MTIIDFEYANMNFQGYDLGTYFNECLIDYAYPAKPGFKAYLPQMIAFLRKSRDQSSEMDHLLKHYLLKRNQIKRLGDRVEENEV